MELFTSVLQFEDTAGNIIDVRKPSIFATEEIKARYEDLLKFFSEESIINMPFNEAYRDIKKIRSTINKILGLVNVDPNKLNADTLFQLFFPHHAIDDDGKEVYVFGGELINFIFGEQKPNEEPRVAMETETIDYIAKTLGGLWGTTEDFVEACTVLNTLSYKDLDSVMSARVEAMTPKEEAHKKRQKEKSAKLADKMRKEALEKQKIRKNGEASLKKVEMRELNDDEIAKFL